MIENANIKDLPEIMELQRLAFYKEAVSYNDFTIQPLTQNLTEPKKEFEEMKFLKYIENDIIAGSVRYKIDNETCTIFKLIVHTGCRNKGIGKALMIEIEK